MTNNVQPFVSIIMPVRNEREFIAGVLDSILCSSYPADKMEIFLAEGMSDDDTIEIVEAAAGQSPVPIYVVPNPERIVSTGLNRAIREARGDIILRMDAHTEYAPDYIEQCVRVLQETGASNVGGPWHACGAGALQSAIALAFHSPFSAGGALSHQLLYEGEVDAVYLGCWPKEIFDQVGLFDEQLVRNQDDEFSLRIKRSGLRLWQSPRIKSLYRPRASLKALFQQYFQYGFWKVAVIRKHRIPASWRHLVPGFFVLGLLSGPLWFSLLRLLHQPQAGTVFLGLYLSLVALYLALNILASFWAICTQDTPRPWAAAAYLPLVFAIYHLAYGAGFMLAICSPRMFIRRASALSRS